MSGILNKKPYPDDSMTDYFVVDKIGQTLVNKATGQVLSNQPGDNHWEERPAGSAGNYEVMRQNGSFATYCPQDGQGKAFVGIYFYLPDVPNL